MDKIKVAANFLKSKFQTDELDAKLTEAVSEENWQASTQLLHEISNASFNSENQQRIIIFIWEKLKNKSWKKVLKTLHLIDFLIKYGPTSLIDNLKENIYEFRKLDDYTNKGDGLDRGESEVRKQAKAVLVLLTDDQLLYDQRTKAKQIKERMSTVIGSGAYFGNFSNESKSSSSDYKGGSNYGNINSQSFKYVPQPNKGTTFGQSVMRELYEKKKSETTETPAPQPSSGLNIQNMIEKKIEKKVDSPTKSSFNSLNLKLVKPPEKKPGEKPVLAVKSPTQSKAAQKPVEKEPKKKVDIMDFDFGGATVEPTGSTNTLDFLGAQTSQPKNIPNSFNLFSQSSSTPQAPFSPPSQPSVGKGDLLGFNLTNLQPSHVGSSVPPPPSYSFTPAVANPQSFGLIGNKSNETWGSGQPASQAPGQQLKISLEVKPGSTMLKKDEGSLIDFSNFREELGSLDSKGKNESISANWNW